MSIALKAVNTRKAMSVSTDLNTECKKNISTALDGFKLFFALCVIAIHTDALAGRKSPITFWINQGIFRLAVPFFFVASGFLLGRKIYGQEQELSTAISGYTGRLVLPLLCVGGANAVLELFLQWLQYGRSLRYLADQFIRHILFYPYGAMWFVQACIVGAWLLYPFLKRKKLNSAIALGMLLYGWALLCNNYFFVAQAAGLDRAVDAYMSLFISARNGLFMGFLFLALGIKTWEFYRADCSLRVLQTILTAVVLLYAAEIYMTQNRTYLDDRSLYLAHTVLIPIMLLCILKVEVSTRGSVAVRMRKASIWLYYSHRFMYGFGRLICFLAFGTQWKGPGAFVVVFAMCAVTFAVADAWHLSAKSSAS